MENQENKNTRQTVFVKPKDIFIVLGLLLIAGVVWLVFVKNSAPGKLAIVTFTNNAETLSIPLNKNDVININTGNLPVVLKVEDGQIRFINSVCPDHICENKGWLINENDSAACAPAGVVVQISAAAEN